MILQDFTIESSFNLLSDKISLIFNDALLKIAEEHITNVCVKFDLVVNRPECSSWVFPVLLEMHV